MSGAFTLNTLIYFYCVLFLPRPKSGGIGEDTKEEGEKGFL